MAVQLSLFDDLPPLPVKPLPAKARRSLGQAARPQPERGDHILFFGAVPPPPVRDAIAARWQELSSDLGLSLRFRQSTLHMSIYGLGVMRSIDPRFIAAFRDIADEVSGYAFELEFTRAAGFGGRAIVLTTDDESSQPLQKLAESLRTRLAGIGMRVPHRLPTIRPHFTLAYGVRIPECLVEPVSWKVDAFSLIDGVHGHGVHNVLGHWNLN